MDDFFRQHDVCRYTSTLHKTILIERDKVRQNSTESCTQKIEDDFTNEVDQANRPKLVHFFRLITSTKRTIQECKRYY